MSRFKKYLLLLCTVFALHLDAQVYDDDAAFWFNIYLEKKLNEKFDISLNQKDRLTNNFSELGRAYADLGLTYHINNSLKVLCDYVFIERRHLDGHYGIRHRGYVALVAKKEFGRLAFIYRNRVQAHVQEIYVSDAGKVPVYYDRNKLTIRYELNKRYDVYVAGELYLPFNQIKRQGFDRVRTFAGVIYNISKQDKLELYYMFQQDLNATQRIKRTFAYGLGFSHEF